jgi:hypothetical protein
MTTHSIPSRRRFLRTALAAGSAMAAGPWWSPLGADTGDTLRIGVIGCGVRGKYLIGNLPESVRVTAICDCATSRMAGTLEPQGEFVEVLDRFRRTDASRCKTYQDYRRLLDREPLAISTAPILPAAE